MSGSPQWSLSLRFPYQNPNTQVHLYVSLQYNYSDFIICIEIQVAQMQTEFFQSFPHHMEGWAGQL